MHCTSICEENHTFSTFTQQRISYEAQRIDYGVV